MKAFLGGNLIDGTGRPPIADAWVLGRPQFDVGNVGYSVSMRLSSSIGIALAACLLVLGFSGCATGATPTPVASEREVPVTVVVTSTPLPTPRPTLTPVLSRLPFDELKAIAARMTYDDLFRNNALQVGRLVYYEGQVVQVLEKGTDSYQLRANVTRAQYSWNDTVFLHYVGPRVLDNDIIEFVGRVTGLLTYTAIFGSPVTIPEITIIQSRLVAKASEPTPTPAPTPTPVISPIPIPTPAPGYGRSNPAGIGTFLFNKVDSLGEMFEARIMLLDVIRGQEALMHILAANRYNDQPEPGFEYALAKVRFEYLKGSTPDTQYRLSRYKFTSVSSVGKDYDRVSMVVPKPELEANLYPGASHEGWVAFQLAQDDKAALMTFGRDYRGGGGLWWKLYK